MFYFFNGERERKERQESEGEGFRWVYARNEGWMGGRSMRQFQISDVGLRARLGVVKGGDGVGWMRQNTAEAAATRRRSNSSRGGASPKRRTPTTSLGNRGAGCGGLVWGGCAFIEWWVSVRSLTSALLRCCSSCDAEGVQYHSASRRPPLDALSNPSLRFELFFTFPRTLLSSLSFDGSPLACTSTISHRPAHGENGTRVSSSTTCAVKW